jgi:hypothetical protein
VGGEHGPVSRRRDVVGRPITTVAALFLRLNAGEPREPHVGKHLIYCRNSIVYNPPNFVQSGELVHYFFAKALWRLGDDGYEKLFPNSVPDERLTWSRYRKSLFDHLRKIQQKDGSWDSQTLLLGPTLITAVPAQSYTGPVFTQDGQANAEALSRSQSAVDPLHRRRFAVEVVGQVICVKQVLLHG